MKGKWMLESNTTICMAAPNNRHHCGIMDNIQPRQRDMEGLSVDFDNIVNENKINIYAFCEGRPVEDVVRMCWMK
jgi:hypothetical protein